MPTSPQYRQHRVLSVRRMPTRGASLQRVFPADAHKGRPCIAYFRRMPTLPQYRQHRVLSVRRMPTRGHPYSAYFRRMPTRGASLPICENGHLVFVLVLQLADECADLFVFSLAAQAGGRSAAGFGKGLDLAALAPQHPEHRVPIHAL